MTICVGFVLNKQKSDAGAGCGDAKESFEAAMIMQAQTVMLYVESNQVRILKSAPPFSDHSRWPDQLLSS